MSPARERAGSLKIDLPTGPSQQVPPIAAAFLVKFDSRKGYTSAWSKSIEDVEVEGIVEFKSFPSGLHNVQEDLVYFTHGDYAGISAFVNQPSPESERNALMLAIGVLVPLSYGRLGKSWHHAEGLTSLARRQISGPESFDALEEFWDKHGIKEGSFEEGSPVESPQDLRPNTDSNGQPGGYHRTRGISDATAFVAPDHFLSPYHPALSMPSFVQSFGPLIFPLYRAALLRKRILFVGEAPVQVNCNFVYNLSIFSSVPKSLLSLLPVDGIPSLRLRPLFNVGVHDIPELSTSSKSSHPLERFDPSWVACTTDDVLATKPALFDILVTLPSAHTKQARRKIYPKIVLSSPSLSMSLPKIGLRSTRRDARRYHTLQAGLKPLPSSASLPPTEDGSQEEDAQSATSDTSSVISRRSIVEPSSWSLVAYSSFIWWASAGDKGAGLSEEESAENEQDNGLLMADLEAVEAMIPSRSDTDVPKEIAMVAYFHRLTSLIFTTISDAISRQDGEDVRRDEYQDEDGDEDGQGNRDEGEQDEEDRLGGAANGTAVASEAGPNESRPLMGEERDEDETVELTREDMTMMGLDVWSAADRKFVEELVVLWWGRRAVVQGGRIQCCGVRII